MRARRKFQLLKTFPNVLITPHSAFLTREALANIAAATVANLQVTALTRGGKQNLQYSRQAEQASASLHFAATRKGR